MKIDLVPALQVQRDLYDLPRDTNRFRRYLEVMQGGTQDIVLPLSAMNPMGQEHVAAALDALLAIDAEAIGRAAVNAARGQLSRGQSELKVVLVLADDVGGGWTNRYLTETSHRFNNRFEAKRGWATALFWTSEAPERDKVRQEVLAGIYRTVYLQRHGLPRTLRQMMDQEGHAAAFAGAEPPGLDPDAIIAAREVIRLHLVSTDFPTCFGCLYGDEAARSVGYPALGLPERAGYDVALEEVRERRSSPAAALLGSPTGV